ncbi:hypothetical protein D9M68_778070 [compost metagenome]
MIGKTPQKPRPRQCDLQVTFKSEASTTLILPDLEGLTAKQVAFLYEENQFSEK